MHPIAAIRQSGFLLLIQLAMLVKITNIKKRIYGIFILSGEVGNKKINSNNAKNIIVLTT